MFNVGDFVVCVDASPSADGRCVPLERGRVYEVAEFFACGTPSETGRWLEDVVALTNAPTLAQRLIDNRWHGPQYRSSRFRPIRKQSIQIFTDIANGVKQPEKENA